MIRRLSRLSDAPGIGVMGRIGFPARPAMGDRPELPPRGAGIQQTERFERVRNYGILADRPEM